MRKLLVLSAFLLVVPQASFAAGLDLTWKNCVLETSQQDINFTNCTAAQTSLTFFACLKSPVPLPNFVAVDMVFDVLQEGMPALQPFWRFDDAGTGGCNDVGITIRNSDDPSDGIVCTNEISPWGPGGGSASSDIFGYVAGFNGIPNRGRLFAAVFRDAADPFPIDPGVNYYICAFTINTQRRAECPGCTGKVEFLWNSAELAENDNNRVMVLGPDKLGNCVTINHASHGLCIVDAVRPTTWNRLKSIYR